MRPGARRELLVCYAATLVVAWWLKHFYSGADAQDLNWILAPASRVAGLIGGIPFEQEAHVGWVSHSGRMIVGPSCAGLNFMIVAFVTFSFSRLHRFAGIPAKGVWLTGCLAISWLATIVTNAVRIILAIHLYSLEIYGTIITPGRVHLVAGTLLYGVSLLIGSEAVCRGVDRYQLPRASREGLSPLVPIFWYLSVVLGVPVATRAWEGDPIRFLEFAALVGLAITAVGFGWFLLRGVIRWSGHGDKPHLHGRHRMRC